MDNDRWIWWMGIGKRLGCHQMAERSFFYRGYQFPVCARCTGVIIASMLACTIFWFWKLHMVWCVVLCAIMFLDWLIQRLGIRQSTNGRRFVTGLLGGYGFMTLQLYAYCACFHAAKNIFLVLAGLSSSQT